MPAYPASIINTWCAHGVRSKPPGSPRLSSIGLASCSRVKTRSGPLGVTRSRSGTHAVGHAFYQAANGVWLTDHVPPGCLSGRTG